MKCYILSLLFFIALIRLSSSSSALDNNESKITAFTNWITENGGFHSEKIKIDYITPLLRRVIAAESIKKDQLLIDIPFDSLGFSEYNKRVKPYLDKCIETKEWKTLCYSYALVQENRKGEDSFFYPHLRLLPASIDNYPLTFGNKYDKLLKGTYLKTKIQENDDYHRKLYGRFQKLFNDPSISYEEFYRFRTFYNTRTFDFEKSGKVVGIAQYVDFINSNKLKKNVQYKISKSIKSYEMIALRDISPGEELFCYYGKKSNYKWFASYGFSVPNNLQSLTVEITVREKQVSLTRDLQIFDKLIENYKSTFDPNLSTKENTTNVLNEILDSTDDLLKNYKTIIFDDYENEEDFNVKNMLEILREEKFILNQSKLAIQMAKNDLDFNKTNEMHALQAFQTFAASYNKLIASITKKDEGKIDGSVKAK